MSSDDEYVIVDNENVTSESGSSDSDSSGPDMVPVVPRRVRQIVLFEYKHNDPKRDSGMKLVRLGLARSFRPGDAFKGIVLSAEGRCVLSQSDKALITSAGIAAINCSWNRLDEVKNIPGGNINRHRKLPFLVASNPINYGKAYKLNSAEAVAAALALVGFREEAESLTEKFSWSDEFWKLNHEYFEVYKSCVDSASMIEAQNRFLHDKLGIEEPEVEKTRVVRFSEAPPDVREFDSNRAIESTPLVVVADPETVLTFPEAPKDQKKCLVFLRDSPLGESLGIKKHASGNVLAKMKRKDYLEIWTKFTADAENLKFIKGLDGMYSLAVMNEPAAAQVAALQHIVRIQDDLLRGDSRQSDATKMWRNEAYKASVQKRIMEDETVKVGRELVGLLTQQRLVIGSTIGREFGKAIRSFEEAATKSLHRIDKRMRRLESEIKTVKQFSQARIIERVDGHELRLRNEQLVAENTALKHELQIVKDKLEICEANNGKILRELADRNAVGSKTELIDVGGHTRKPNVQEVLREIRELELEAKQLLIKE